MRAFIRHIGILDHKDIVHAVSFGPGVNVVTGKSSTGKSALIEIFDYCFGSSDSTVPEGVITESASIYFTVIHIKEINLVLARKTGNNRGFIKEASDAESGDVNTFQQPYFANDYFLPLDDYKKEIGRYFGLDITNVDTSLEAKAYRGNRKSPTPSIRSLASFILQHQNLIANKHAVFYRFDEEIKREQAIEHFKIFAGFVDQTYFVKSQQLDILQSEQRQIELRIPRVADIRKKAEADLRRVLDEYFSISGVQIDIGSVGEAIQNPIRALEKLKKISLTVLPQSDQHATQRHQMEMEMARLTAELRKSQQTLTLVQSSISFAKNYDANALAVAVPSDAELHASSCPFCNTHHPAVEREANRLTEAIEWLNTELHRSPYLIGSFEEEEQDVVRKIQSYQQGINELDGKIKAIDQQITDLANFRTQYELTLKTKLQVETVLDQVLAQKNEALDVKLDEVKNKIAALKHFLAEHYNVDSKLKEAEQAIWDIMAELGKRFDFEESFHPINLRFSLDTFDLWHQGKDKKVFLRSMGSGANWLYCHLTLFLALHKYFCSLGDTCIVPSVLFLDQPSQVYFPSILDNETEFSPTDLAKKQGETRKRPVDDDINAVTNLYSQLVVFCKEVLEKTGIEPQIIVTDHADNLTLAEGMSFESLVQGRRWRDRGFIHPSGNSAVLLEVPVTEL